MVNIHRQAITSGANGPKVLFLVMCLILSSLHDLMHFLSC